MALLLQQGSEVAEQRDKWTRIDRICKERLALLRAAQDVLVFLERLQADPRHMHDGSLCSIAHYAEYHTEALGAAVKAAR